MYQNCLRQQPNAATYITSPNGASSVPQALQYDRSPYCYPTTSPTNPQSVVYHGSVYSQSNGSHLSDLTSAHCLAAQKPPVPVGLTDASHPGSTSPAGALYWPHYHQHHQRGPYPVAPAGSTPPTTYYDPSRRVMSPSGGHQWSAANDVQFGGGHSTVSDGQPSSVVEGYSAAAAAYRASVGGDLGYGGPTAGGERRGGRGGGGGGEEVLPQQPRQHPSYVLASHQTSLKVNTAGSRSGHDYQRSTPTVGQRVNAGSSAAVQGHVAPPFDWMRKHAYPTIPSSGKTRTKDKYRIVYTELQKVELEKEFLYNQYITIQRKAELAVAIGLSDRQVKIWFQNRRAKDRKQKRKRTELHHHPHPPTSNLTPPTAKTTTTSTTSSSSASATAAAGATTHNNNNNNNNTSLLSSPSSASSASSSSSSSSSSLVLKQEMMMMRCEDAVKRESNFVDSIGRSSVANGNGAYDVIPIC